MHKPERKSTYYDSDPKGKLQTLLLLGGLTLASIALSYSGGVRTNTERLFSEEPSVPAEVSPATIMPTRERLDAALEKIPVGKGVVDGGVDAPADLDMNRQK